MRWILLDGDVVYEADVKKRVEAGFSDQHSERGEGRHSEGAREGFSFSYGTMIR